MSRMQELVDKKDKMVREIIELNREVIKKNPIKCGCPTPAFIKEVGKINEDMDRLILEIFEEQEKASGPAHFSRDNVWCWGGPTPLWGGSMDKDISIKGAQYFGFDNVVYLHGPVNDEAMRLHSKCSRLLCALSDIGRSPGAQPESDVETAENLSRFSLTYKNIKGGIIDDLIQNYGPRYSFRDVQNIRDALRKHNDSLELYTVVYTHELDLPATKALRPLIDRVNLWFWMRSELADMDYLVEKCRHVLPGKKIMLGVFMHDYGLGGIGNTPAVILAQLARARKLLAAGKIDEIVILGDREIAKHPDTAQAIKEFFASEFKARG